MAEHETIADLVAEIRALSNPISDGIIAINGKSIADRLDAAHKREKTAIEADALTVGGMVEAARKRERGDAAKLREAVAYLFTLIDMRKLVLDCDEAEEIYAIQVMLDEARAALSAPPRNCDVYDSYGDAIRAFEDAENAEDYEDVAEWLYAPATEQEGGDK